MVLYPFGNKYFFVLLRTATYLSLLWDVLGIGTAIVGCCELDYNNQQVCLLTGAVGEPLGNFLATAVRARGGRGLPKRSMLHGPMRRCKCQHMNASLPFIPSCSLICELVSRQLGFIQGSLS